MRMLLLLLLWWWWWRGNKTRGATLAGGGAGGHIRAENEVVVDIFLCVMCVYVREWQDMEL